MNKADYLADPQVRAFTGWFARQLDAQSTLGHFYLRPGGAEVRFANLADALAQYHWRFGVDLPDGRRCEGSSFDASRQALDELKILLDAALARGDDDAACAAACAVMQWGGVSGGNVAWLRRNRAGLAALLAGVRDRLAGAAAAGPCALAPGLRFNAGMSKVYSLLVPDFVIYDSRVAAALAWFVMRWKLEQPGGLGSAVPDGLDFPCMPAKEGPNAQVRKIRNPGTLPCVFQRMNNRPLLHAEWNLRASWLLATALEQSRWASTAAGDGLRALEAALFMWGYDVGPNSPWLQAGAPVGAEPGDDAADEELPGAAALAPSTRGGGETLHTFGARRIGFCWNLDEASDELVIVNGKEREIRLPVRLVFQAMHAAYDWFGAGRIPLANNVERLANRSEQAGLGTALQSSGGTPVQNQAASYLGPILASLGWFAWNGRQVGIEFSFLAPPPASIAALRERLSEFAR